MNQSIVLGLMLAAGAGLLSACGQHNPVGAESLIAHAQEESAAEPSQPAPEPTAVPDPAEYDILFTAKAALLPGREAIYTCNRQGGDVMQLAASGWGADLTRDARRIVYCEASIPMEVWTMNADGSDPRSLGEGRSPRWSWDGRKIAACDIAGNILVMDADGTNRHSVAQGGYPVWTADGRIVYFREAKTPTGWEYSLRVMGADGSDDQVIANLYGYPGDCAADGTLVYAGFPDGGDKEICRINLDGSGLAQLTHNACLDQNPRFSPDGQHILFVSDRDGQYDIYELNRDGAGVRRITNTPAYEMDAVRVY